MASEQITSLLAPPSVDDAHKRTKDYLNVRFKTFEDVQHAQGFDDLVSNASQRSTNLRTKVRFQLTPMCIRLIQLS